MDTIVLIILNILFFVLFGTNIYVAVSFKMEHENYLFKIIKIILLV